MNTKTTLKNATKVAALAFLLVRPALAGTPDDTSKYAHADAEVKEAYLNLESYTAKVENELTYFVPVDRMNRAAELTDAYAAVEEFARNMENMLVYEVKDHETDVIDSAGAALVLDRIEATTNSLINTITYEVEAEAPFVYDYEVASAHEYLATHADRLEKKIAYAVPVENTMEYDYELALAKEGLEKHTDAIANRLAYSAPIAETPFEYNFERAAILEDIERDLMIVSSSMIYNVPANTANAVVLDNERRNDPVARLYTIQRIDIARPVFLTTFSF